MNKKHIFLILSALAVSGLASCGGNTPASSSQATTSQQATTEAQTSKASQQMTTEGQSETSSQAQTSDDTSEATSQAQSESASEGTSEASSEVSQGSEEIASQEQSQSEPEALYSVSVETSTITTINVDKSEAKEGDIVKVTATAISGFEVSGIKVLAGENEILVNEDGNAWVFTMPAANVIVSASYNRLAYSLTITDVKNLVSSVLVTPIGEQASEWDKQSGIEFEALVKITFVNTAIDSATGISIKGDTKQYNVDNNNAVSFRMPAKNVEVNVLFASKDVALTGTVTDHLTASFVDAEGNEIEYAAKYEKAYVKVESTDAERYSPATLEIQYNLGSDLSATKKSILSSYDAETGLYSFDVPNTGKVTLAMTERDAIAFENSEIVGTYLSSGLLSKSLDGSKENDWWNGGAISVAASGEITYGNESYQISSINEEAGSASLTNYSTIYFGNKLVLVGTSNSTSSALSSPWSSFDYLWVKKEKATDSDELYTNSVLTFVYQSHTYRAYQVFKEDKLYASCFVDVTSQIVYFDAELRFVNSTTKVHENQSQFEVVINGEVLLAVGYVNEGGRGNRILMNGVYGDYTCDNKVASFSGEGHALYEGVSYTVEEKENDVVVLSSNTLKLTLQLNKAARTFTITASEEIEVNLAFKGHLYRGSFYNDWDEVTNYFFMQFDATASTFISCVGSNADIAPGKYSFGARYMSNNTSAYGDPLAQSYTYEPSTGVLTATIFDCANSKEMTFVYSQANNTFTCQIDYTSNMYSTKGMVMTLVA